MKKISMIVLAFIVGFLAVSFASTAYADHDKVRVISVKDEFNNRTVYTENPVTQCKEVDVPIYQQKQGQGNLGDFLAGAIIGGAIGNNVSNDKGAGAIGAIIGGAIANENAKKKNSTSNVVGYKRENICETTVTKQRQIIREYMYTTIQFEYNGNIYSVRFTK